jgi:AAA domain-containing protein
MTQDLDPALADVIRRRGEPPVVSVPKPNGSGMPDEEFFEAGAPPKSTGWTWVKADEVFYGPAVPARWVVRDLGIAPGRPTLLSGASGGAKTIIAQSLALALATGRPIWGRFMRPEDVQPIKVAHVDVDLGMSDVVHRYRRLYAGFPGAELPRALLEQNFKLVSFPTPRIDLRQEHTRDKLRRELAGVDFCIMDALRGLASGNENDSEFRLAVDMLTAVSGDIGVTFFLLHHLGNVKIGANGKPIEDDDSAGRGTTGIRDGSGAVLKITGSRKKGRKLRMIKPPGRMGVDWAETKYDVAIDDIEGDLVDGEAKPLRVTVSVEHQKSKEEIADDAAKIASKKEAQVREACVAIVRQAGSDGYRGGIDRLVRTVRDALKSTGHEGVRNEDGRSVVRELVEERKLFLSGAGPSTRITLLPTNELLNLEAS